jgi:hypothetical protein
MADTKKGVFSGVAGMHSREWCGCPGLQILRGRKAGKKCTF